MIASKNAVKWIYRLDEDKNPWNPNDEEGEFLPEEPIALESEVHCYDEKGVLRLILYKHGGFTVKKGYAWNGCTPKFGFFDILVGTPDGVVHKDTGKPKAYYATMIHDSLYQFIPDIPKKHRITRKAADRFFLELLAREDFILRWIYWLAVRIFGGIAMLGRRNVTRRSKGHKKAISVEE